jgi:hypothetical protein
MGIQKDVRQFKSEILEFVPAFWSKTTEGGKSPLASHVALLTDGERVCAPLPREAEEILINQLKIGGTNVSCALVVIREVWSSSAIVCQDLTELAALDVGWDLIEDDPNKTEAVLAEFHSPFESELFEWTIDRGTTVARLINRKSTREFESKFRGIYPKLD